MKTNFDLIRLAKKYNIPLVDVVNKDLLFYLPKKDGGYIINLDDTVNSKGQRNSGSHWVAFFIWNGKAVFYDSFGIVPDYTIQNFLKGYAPFEYNTREIQNINSGICGDFCLFFLYFMSRKVKYNDKINIIFKEFLEIFSNDVLKNETILRRILKVCHLWSL